jgi:hypothetical protein
MNKRGGKKHKKVRNEVDSFLYDKEIKEIDSFLEEKKEKTNEKNKKKFGKGDVVFVIIYIIILFLFLMIIPVYISSSLGETEVLWDNIVWILIYTIVVPILYFLIRINLRRQNETV